MIGESVSWFLTWNNPIEHCEALKDHEALKGFDHKAATPAQFETLQRIIVNMFIHSGRRERNPETSSILIGCEAGEKDTFHIHMLICSKTATKFDSLTKLFPKCEIEPTRGHYYQCRNYIFKEGTNENEAKSETMLCVPYEWGEFQVTRKDNTSEKSVFDQINDLLDEGKTPKEIYTMDAKYSYYANAIERTYNARKKAEIPLKRELIVYYHVGESQTGKSHCYYDLIDKYGEDEVYTIAEYKWPFDDYHFEKCIIFDEFRDEDIEYRTLLTYLDERPLKLNIKSSKTYAAWNEVHITSVVPPEHLYLEKKWAPYDTRDQLDNRIDYIVYHWKDDEGGFHQFQLPYKEYENYNQLVRLVEKKKENPEGSPMTTESEKGSDEPFYIGKKADTPIQVTELISEPNNTEHDTIPIEEPNPPQDSVTDLDTSLQHDIVKYYEWEKHYLPAMDLVPEVQDFKTNPFIEYEYYPGVSASTRLDYRAFLDDCKAYFAKHPPLRFAS